MGEGQEGDEDVFRAQAGDAVADANHAGGEVGVGEPGHGIASRPGLCLMTHRGGGSTGLPADGEKSPARPPPSQSSGRPRGSLVQKISLSASRWFGKKGF